MVGSILVQDRPVPVEYARSVAAARPDWRLHVFDELGHLPQLEAPDAWLAITVDWLAETRLLHTAAPSQR
jgi:pimeloyl-ACP methyl ester carboxylesterase